MAHTFINLLTHVIFSTKDRLPSIDTEVKPHLLAYLGGIVRELDGRLLIVNGTPDHVHYADCLATCSLRFGCHASC